MRKTVREVDFRFSYWGRQYEKRKTRSFFVFRTAVRSKKNKSTVYTRTTIYCSTRCCSCALSGRKEAAISVIGIQFSWQCEMIHQPRYTGMIWITHSLTWIDMTCACTTATTTERISLRRRIGDGAARLRWWFVMGDQFELRHWNSSGSIWRVWHSGWPLLTL